MKEANCILAVVVLVSCVLYGFEIEDPNYEAEEYASYSLAGLQNVRGVEFDGLGNLYVAYDEGAVVRIDPGGIASVFVDEHPNYQAVEWGGGTPYEERIYVSSPYTDEVIVADPNGTTSSFCTFDAEPLGLGIDRVGNYGGKLYVGTRYPGEIYSVSETGDSDFFLAVTEPSDAHVNDFAFDPTGMYGGLMFISISSKIVEVDGIFSVDLDGVITQFPVGTKIYTIAFDTTDDLQFNGQLYMQRSSYAIRRMAPDGTAERFIAAVPDTILRRFTFGPDGMYVLEEVGGVVTVYRVFKRPSLLDNVIENIEAAIAEKGVALEAVETSLANEQAAYAILGEMLDSGDYGDFTRQDIAKAIKKLKVSIAEQGRVIRDLEDSIARLEDALMLLGVE